MSDRLIIGSNNFIPATVTDIVVLGKSSTEFTEDDAGKVFLGPSAVVKSTGEIEAVISPAYGIETSNFVTIPGRKNYFIDATLGNIAVTLNSSLNEYKFIRVDGTGNTVTITPTSGTINGGASVTIPTQNQIRNVVFNGTNYYTT